MSRILFDQNVPRALAKLLTGHEVRTAADQGWQELENGDLLKAAEDAGFFAMVTADQNIRYQQNLAGRKIALVVLSTNHWKTLRENAVPIAAALARAREGYYAEVRLTPARTRRRSRNR